MSDDRYDLVTIGGGSGGLTAAIFAARVGAKVLLVDRERLGGDCLYYGCVPSKALIASARAAHRMRRAETFGLRPVEVTVDFPAVMQRIARIQERIAEGESPDALERHGVEVAFGGARFIDEHTIEVGSNRRVHAERTIIATGSHAVTPDIPGLGQVGSINHVGLFEITELPGRLVVLGGGPIGCEMGQALSRLGAQVTIVQRRDQLLPREERQIARVIQDRFREEGIRVLLSTNVVEVKRSDRGKVVVVEEKGTTRNLECDEILVAVGRGPSIDGLDLGAAGVVVSAGGIEVNDALQTSRSDIYAVGDCNGGPQFTHWAEYEARIATRNALFRGRGIRSTQRIPWVTFTDPEVARVGSTLEQARKKHAQVHAHEVPMSKADRAVCEDELEGFIRVVVDRKDRILGVHITGAAAGEVLTEWILAMDHGLPLDRIGSSIHPYPTFSRVNRRLADERFLEHGLSAWTTGLFARFTRTPK